jgi:FkbM family methyltransferase
MERDLIFDVGMNNGDDTAHYLDKGYCVIAVEADPTLVEEGRLRFGDALRRGQLQIVNAAIGPREEAADFWICDQKREWNSFDRSVAARDGLPHHAIPVRCRTFRSLLDEYGTPFYLKIDIEGHDHYCVEALEPPDLPRYVSLELGPLETLFKLHELGYRGFKLITQNDHSQLQVNPLTLRAYVKRRLRSFPPGYRLTIGTGRLARAGAGFVRNMAALAGSARPAHTEPSFAAGAAVQLPAHRFPFGSSGPFGEDTPGAWQDLEQTAFTWVAYQLGQSHYGSPGLSVWHGLHASLERN